MGFVARCSFWEGRVSLFLIAAMMLVQAPAVQPQPDQPKAAKVKPAQVCEYIEVTGSRSKRRVCHDADANADLSAYGVSGSLYGKGHSVPQSGGPVGTGPGDPGGSH
jgi:hypothetical protein